ncbi:uncharacterized protein PV09_00492 [Verruconis gallopava]|uniref:F-box domain-containing protein n=1 Tax=Verruconis gallopava TaxID=253628 RepID=A0A0D2AT03_9PEZI|nr:uncharacterized protein PV09_00492 [Verruconis gallopava]KIW09625.1 hypothetical protein PV09_00492 [Verruconis gallopava]
MNLLELPSEILAQTFVNLRYFDLLSILATCRTLYTFSEDQVIWREVFLREFDDPRVRIRSLTETPRKLFYARHGDFDWFIEFRKRIIALSCLRNADTARRSCHGDKYEAVVETLLDIIDTADASPAVGNEGTGRSRNISLLPTNSLFSEYSDSLIRGTLVPKIAIFDKDESDSQQMASTIGQYRAGSWQWDPSPGRPMTRSRAALEAEKFRKSENSSRLHVLRGITAYEEEDEKDAGRSRRICYDWTLTNERNEYGPWKDDGSGKTDWRRIEAIASVVTRQFIQTVKDRVSLPQGFAYSLPNRVSIDPSVPDDWAGIQRRWVGTYVFMHWEDLVEFNESRGTSIRSSLEYTPEACGGLMKLDLKLNMDLKDDPTLNTMLPVCFDFPPLYFSGLSRSEEWQMATAIRGMCCLAPGGREVRWRYIVHYGGSDQWQLEGVQPGGVRSGCVYGTWTSVLHEDDGPVGPFIYAPEELCKLKCNHILAHNDGILKFCAV